MNSGMMKNKKDSDCCGPSVKGSGQSAKEKGDKLSEKVIPPKTHEAGTKKSTFIK